ncbi:alanine racemase [Evansella sp. AB-P1]|uniref:alanine racemase n=1 Tax=Evansella sp. AB-P1 TaxID=3037653 RepID=UPI00241F0E08|nr:alanine racemase [Evansella sp. AB-P1]MDG5786106.1 alanine racemase [Evansella sp. AB-P1]
MVKSDVYSIETPALILTESKMINNIQRMLSVKEKYNVNVRPHFKTHKSIKIAKEQLKQGASGITVATATEAELLLENGVEDILVAFPLSDKKKIFRLLKWVPTAKVIFTIDSMDQALIIHEAAEELHKKAEVWIKVNCGLNRCGVEPGLEVYELAKETIDKTDLQLTGLYTHAGHSYGATRSQHIDEIAKFEAESIVQSAKICEERGISIRHRSVGSTPTFEKAAQYEGITEVRPGNAVFFDGIQVGLGVAQLEEVALTVLATVVSIKKDRCIIDAGSKALTTEKGAHGNESIKGFGQLLIDKPLYVSRVSEEHGVIEVTGDQIGNQISLNEKVNIIPNHACPVVNLFDYYYVMKEDGTIERMKVDGRGKSQ